MNQSKLKWATPYLWDLRNMTSTAAGTLTFNTEAHCNSVGAFASSYSPNYMPTTSGNVALLTCTDND